MSIVDELITDRTQADVTRVRELALKGWANLTEEEKAEWNAGMKGAYNATDLNRVTQAMDYINAELEGYGYVTGYEKVEVPHEAQPVSPLPDGYVQLEYIESTGTQYIDTGFKPNQDTRTIIDFQSTAAPSNDWLLGVRRSTNVDSYGTMAGSDTSITSWFGTASVTQTVNALTNRFVLDKNKEETTIEYESGESTSFSNSSSEFESEYNLFLLNINLAGSAASAAISGNLYYCQMYNGDALVRDFVPCKDPSGEVGLYDLVSGVFYGNAGTGTFTDGPEVEAPDEPTEELDPYTWYIQDIPTQSQMQAYLANVTALRGALTVWADTPSVPADMAGLTYQEANDIETILGIIETLINNMAAAWFFSGDVYSGEVDA